MREQERHRPGDAAELTALVAWAAAEKRPLEVLGNGTKRALGRPVEARHVLELSGLRGIPMYEPEELVMTAAAGTPLVEVERALEECRQELAFEPADYGAVLGGEPGRQTIGGVFACNLAGPRRIRAGAARDHFLGVRCVTGHGQAIKAGGRVVKNVTGYDLCKLLAGSYGTLAVMSELTFKVLPRAEDEATLLLWGLPEAELLGVLRRAMATAHDVSSAACLTALGAGRSAVAELNRWGRAVAAVRVEGPEPSVAYRLERLEAELAAPGLQHGRLGRDDSRTLWREVRDVALIPRGRALWRVSLPPAAASELAGWAAEFAPERLWDWAGGLLWLAPRPAWADAAGTVRRALEGRGGHATLVRADEETRRAVPVFEPQAAPLAALTARVKRSFDPAGVLNPGRMHADV
jgi:glycolate oxidase FAD binding subunit